ncbi:lipopolysaccharide biosynthesis protein [Patulibacter sp. S7RM1-6]
MASKRTSQIAASLGAGIASQGLLLVSGVIAARLLGPADRGHLALIWTIVLTVTLLGSVGLPLAATYAIASRRTDVRGFLSVLGRLPFALTAAMLAASGAALVPVVVFTGTPWISAALGMACVPFIVIVTFGVAFLQGQGAFRALNVTRVLPSAGYAAGLVVLLASGVTTLTAVTAVWAASYVVAAGAVSWAVSRQPQEARPEANEHPPYRRRDAVSFGRRALFGSVSPTETFRVDQLLVGVFLSPRDLGIYVAALAFTNLPRFLAQAVGLVAYPAVASMANDPARQWRATWRFTALAAAMSIPVIAVIAALAHPLVTLAFGSEFGAAAAPLRLLLGATLLVSVRRVLTDSMRGLGYPSVGSRAEILSWCVLVPSVVGLAGPFGLMGVSAALVLTYATSLAYLAHRAVQGTRRSTDSVPARSPVPDTPHVAGMHEPDGPAPTSSTRTPLTTEEDRTTP